jgi:hypothetical protein
MERMGTSAAAVPAAITSEKEGSSSYLICLEREYQQSKVTQWQTTYRAHFSLPSKALRNLQTRVTSHRLNNISAVWHHKRDIFSHLFYTNKSTCRELINLAPRLAVQVQRDSIACLASFLTMPQHRRIVSTHLRRSSSIRRRSIEVLKNKSLDGVDTVVYTHGQHIHAKSVLLWWVQAQLCRASKDQRTDIHSSPGLVRWDISCV